MRVAFFCEQGKIPEVGTGHYWRSRAISDELVKRGHTCSWATSGDIPSDANVLVIDHVKPQTDIINRAKSLGLKIVLIDGVEEDAGLVDTSISARYNPAAQYTGREYMAFAKCLPWKRYRTQKASKSKTVFVSMGGFDACNLAEKILPTIGELGMHAIVTRSNNHPDFKEKFGHVEVFDEENYYDAMEECIIGVTNGGLTLFQALHYGLPCIAVPQYHHQRLNADLVKSSCLSVPVSPDWLLQKELKKKIEWLMAMEYRRHDLSTFAQHAVDGKGVDRVCKIIEDLA